MLTEPQASLPDLTNAFFGGRISTNAHSRTPVAKRNEVEVFRYSIFFINVSTFTPLHFRAHICTFHSTSFLHCTALHI